MSEQGVEVAEKVLRAARSGLVGGGDSVDALMTAARTMYTSLARLGSREEAILLLRDSLAYLPAGTAYTGALATLSIVLGEFAEDLSRDPRKTYLKPKDIGTCIYQGVLTYLREALSKLYDYCRETSSGTVIVVPRGSLALTCAVGALHGGARVVLPVSKDDIEEEEEKESAFDRVRAERIPWYYAYQLIPETVRIVSQAELVAPTWGVVTRGTRELILEYYSAKGSGQGIDILTLLANIVTSGEVPEERKLPLHRVRTPWQVEVELPLLEVVRLRRSGRGGVGAVVTEMGPLGLSRPRLIATRRNTLRALRGVITNKCEK